MRWLTIDRCPHGIYAVSLDCSSGGARLSPQTCCGRWNRIKAWPMSAKELTEMADELLAHAYQLDAEVDAETMDAES